MPPLSRPSANVFTPDANPRPPVVLIVSEQEWLARSLETLVAEQGMVTVRAYAGRDALSLGMNAVADVVVSDTRLADVSGVDLARALQATSDLGTALPVVLITTDDPDRKAVLEALEAGVWEYLAFPFDGASFSARLRTFSRRQAARRPIPRRVAARPAYRRVLAAWHHAAGPGVERGGAAVAHPHWLRGGRGGYSARRGA
jgi:DNA-binding response OmpR family regulator